ncbi:10016_t:CDS:2, partial [Ambispora leptoticha]
MIFDKELAKLSLPPELLLFPGETVEFSLKTDAIKLFVSTADGGFTEYGGKPYENYDLIDAVTESIVVISNYRTCYQPIRTSSTHDSSLLYSPCVPFIHIPHLTINNIEHSAMQITISQKFSSSKYLFKFSKPKPSTTSGNFINIRTTAISLCEDFLTILKKFAQPTSVENVFAFRMGEKVFQLNSNKVTEVKNIMTKESKSHKLTLEEQIFDDLFGDNSSSDDTDNEVESKGIDEKVYKTMQILGWSKGYRIQKEFERMQMNPDSWCIASVNDDFTLSPTYPQDFILPSKILKAASSTDSDSSENPPISVASQPTSMFFRNLARFRSRGRFPVICWKKGLHVLMRSGQPMTGFLGTRGFEDELLIREVLRAVNDEQHNIIAASKGNSRRMKNSFVPYSRTSNMSGAQYNTKVSTKICILDARGYASAFSNGCGGGGYENAENYPTNTSLNFLGLSNIHTISSSHDSLLRAISASSTSSNWYSVLESTLWLSHVADLLKAAGGRDGVVGKIVDDDASVLVHCTDGWDRTTQLVSLAQIMLDPYYRTIKGMQVLIEKEWVAFGHPFRARGDLPSTLLSSDSRKHNSDKYPSSSFNVQPAQVQSTPAPVFLLFLTCVHHLVQQFPAAFEYNDFFLLCLARAGAGNSPFGDFLCNSECERDCLRLRERTTSIWGWVRERKQWFRNAGYQRPRKHEIHYHSDGTINQSSWKKMVLRPDTEARMITLWAEYYFPKDDLSIPLLSTPSGAEFIVPHGMHIPPAHHSYQVGGFPKEYYLVSLFVKRRQRKIVEKVWRTWRSLVLEKKRKRQQQLHQNHRDSLDEQETKCEQKKSKILRQEDKDDKWDIEEMVVTGEDGDGNNETDSPQSELLHQMKKIDDSRVFLMVKTPADNNRLVGGGIRQQRKSSTDSTSTLSTSGGRSQSPNSENSSLSDDDDYEIHQENKEKALIWRETEQYEPNLAVRELFDSHLQEWVELARQNDVTPVINEFDHDSDIADLLREAQMDSDNSLGGSNKNTIEELLMEAQTDTSPAMDIRSHDIDNTTKMTLCLDGIHDSNCNHNTICNTLHNNNTSVTTTVINKRTNSLSSITNATTMSTITSKLSSNSPIKTIPPTPRKYVDVNEFSTAFERPIKKSSSVNGVSLSTRNSMQDLG